MSENHNHEWQEELEQLLQKGQPTSDRLLNDLASTVPEARPAFQQQLAQELAKTLQLELSSMKGNMMQTTRMQMQDRNNRFKREQSGFPLTLAAAVAVLLVGLAVILMMAAPKPDEPELQAFAAIGGDETSTAIWSREATLKATVMANNNLAQEEEARLVTATPFLPPSPQAAETILPPTIDPSMGPFAQTPTAIIARATDAVAGTAFAEAQAQLDASQQSMPLTATAVRPDADNGTICQIVDPAGSVALHTQPRAESEVIGRLPAESRLEVTTVVTEAQRGETWLYTEYYQMGQLMNGWVRAAEVRVLAICFYDSQEYALLNGQPEQPGLLQPTAMPPTEIAPVTPTYPVTPSATAIPTITPTVTASATFLPTSGAGVLLEVNIQVSDPPIADLLPLVGEWVDVFMVMGDSRQQPAIIPVARRVRLVKASGTIMTSATVLARDPDQAELLAGLSSSGVEIKISPSE